jgi:hypothetical protein
VGTHANGIMAAHDCFLRCKALEYPTSSQSFDQSISSLRAWTGNSLSLQLHWQATAGSHHAQTFPCFVSPPPKLWQTLIRMILEMDLIKQMLGKKISSPERVNSHVGELSGQIWCARELKHRITSVKWLPCGQLEILNFYQKDFMRQLSKCNGQPYLMVHLPCWQLCIKP